MGTLRAESCISSCIRDLVISGGGDIFPNFNLILRSLCLSFTILTHDLYLPFKSFVQLL